MKYRFENKVEFYITNVCNLTCDNCNRFNNHYFSGWQRWSDYESVYQQWAQHIELNNVTLIGGEPLLNPTICEWVQGIHKIFNCGIQILTNGIRLNKVAGLYDALYKTKKGHITISLHNINHWAQIKQDITQFLGRIIEEYGPAVEQDRNDGIYYSARDINKILVNVYLQNDFQQAAVIADSNGTWTLHNSDPVAAHNICGFARYKCYHFIKGQLYKCGPVALFPEFDQQFNLNLSATDKQLVNSYQPMTVELWPANGAEFMQQIDQPIEQCKFCPSSANMRVIYPVVKSEQTAK